MMKLVIECAICRETFTVEGSAAGQRVHCPTCRGPIKVRPPRLAESEILNILTGRAARLT